MSDWIEWKWTPEKPYPETLETEVVFKFTDDPDGYTGKGCVPVKVGKLIWKDSGRISHYRIAED